VPWPPAIGELLPRADAFLLTQHPVAHRAALDGQALLLKVMNVHRRALAGGDRVADIELLAPLVTAKADEGQPLAAAVVDGMRVLAHRAWDTGRRSQPTESAAAPLPSPAAARRTPRPGSHGAQRS